MRRPLSRRGDLWTCAFGVHWRGSIQGNQMRIAATLLRMPAPFGVCAGGVATEGFDQVALAGAFVVVC